MSISDPRASNFVLFSANPLPENLATPINCETTVGIECLQKYSITKGTYIQNMCAGSDEVDCNKDIDTTSKLAIIFTRPNLNAKIYK